MLTSSETLRHRVFSVMRKDDTTAIAQGDVLIGALGDVWLAKTCDNKLKCHQTTSFRMKLAARVLTEACKKLQRPNLFMYELIDQTHFDAVADVALQLCEPKYDKLTHPIVALKIGYDIARMAGLKIARQTKQEMIFEGKMPNTFWKQQNFCARPKLASMHMLPCEKCTSTTDENYHIRLILKI